mgnify:CR=1 FL=1
MIAQIADKPLKQSVRQAAWKQLYFTVDPLSSSLLLGAQHAFEVGVLKKEPRLDKLVDLSLLKARGDTEIAP